MIKKTDKPEDKEIVYTMCEREIVRQVSVQCVERGRLLNKILKRFPSQYRLKEKKLRNELKSEIADKEIEFNQLKAQHLKEIEEYENKIKDYEDMINKSLLDKPDYTDMALRQKSR